ncbi:MAG TPA: L-2-hydroxyglutarate oxidase [Gemmataceae bacterium]|nr:L-2-hydroxyglutarate oxidase [Gemmataceae bacterium]
MTTASYDVAVIGGGIVGMATALALTRRFPLRLIVLEAENRLAAHQTGNNSGVIHSGIYYKPGSLKARNCVEGREALYRFCQEHGIAHERCGKIIVAADAAELGPLEELERRGHANRVALERLTPERLREFEPHVAGIAGLQVPVTGIVNYSQVTQTFAKLVQERGGVTWTGARVYAAHKKGMEIILETARGDVTARYLINCGGLHSDRIARMCGVATGIQIIPFRGEYYELVPQRQFLVKNLIYPVPDPRFPFLGVHFTRMIGGGVEAGPNAVLALKREGYRFRHVSLKDTLEMARFGGFWRMVRTYWKTGMGELFRSFSKRAFVRALQKLIPELRLEDIQPAGAGVRAQAVDGTGALVDDFRLAEADRMIHVLNAPSPAATASISIGNTIADLAVKNFDLRSPVQVESSPPFPMKRPEKNREPVPPAAPGIH